METILVRECVPGDEDDYCRLNLSFIAEAKASHPYWDAIDTLGESDLRAIFRSVVGKEPSVTVFMASVSGRAVGFANALSSYSVWSKGMAMTIDDLYVDPGYRNDGVGRAIMSYLEEYARSQGYKRLQLHAELDNDKAQGLYRKLGYSEEGMIFFMKPIV